MESDKTSRFWDMLVFMARLRKRETILRRTLVKSVEKKKLQNQNIQSQRGFILATLYNEKDVR